MLWIFHFKQIFHPKSTKEQNNACACDVQPSPQHTQSILVVSLGHGTVERSCFGTRDSMRNTPPGVELHNEANSLGEFGARPRAAIRPASPEAGSMDLTAGGSGAGSVIP